MSPTSGWPNIQTKDLFVSSRVGWPETAIGLACGWVEAENVLVCKVLICKWFDYMQAGEADLHKPDPFWKPRPGVRQLTQERADRVIAELDDDFAKESGRFPEDEAGNLYGPEFSRLSPSARIAFCQEFLDVHKTKAEILAEATRRLASGEVMPPWGEEPVHAVSDYWPD